MHIISTELNQRLSEWVRSRVAADQSLISGRVGFWRFVGAGLAAFGIGTAVGIGFYGYSFVTSNRDNINVLSATFANALAGAQLRGAAEGTVRLEPNEINLASGQTISLDKSSSVQLEPGARVLADGHVRIYAPAPAPIQQSAPQPSPREPITNFTVFKRVPFDNGTVMTGWKFATSTQKSPSTEYCYFTMDGSTPGMGVAIDLGADRKLEMPKSAPKTFNAVKAFEKCVWFRGEG